jgi:hypothetical protein
MIKPLVIALIVSTAALFVGSAQASGPSCQDKYQACMAQCYSHNGNASCTSSCLDIEHSCLTH